MSDNPHRHDDHDCPVVRSSGGLIGEKWCSASFAEVLVSLPSIASPADVLDPRLLLVEEGPVSVYYCPFDRMNLGASVVIVGITPGLHQMYLSCQAAQAALRGGSNLEVRVPVESGH